MISRLFLNAFALLLIGTACAGAETVSVGRAVINLPEGLWQVLSVDEGKTLLNNGASGALAMDNQAFVLTTGNEVKALLYISSSKGGTSATTNWTNTCISTEFSYASSLTSSPNRLECGIATGILKTDMYLKNAVPQAFAAVEARRLVLPPITQSTSATVGNSNGISLHINLLAVPAFMGFQTSESLNVPVRVKAAHAAWTRELAVAIKESVYSMGGKMTIPAVNFAAPGGTTSTPK